MATASGLGIPFPRMLPVTGTWILPFATWGVVLSARVVLQRVNTDTSLGDRSHEGASSKKADDKLFTASRAHGNFVENVPLALAVAAIAELNGANKRVLNYALGLLFALRVAHVELGLKRDAKATGIGRPIGYLGTNGVVLGLATYTAYLVKGYWGY